MRSMKLLRVHQSAGPIGVVSVPVLPGETLIAPPGAMMQNIPVGFWPAGCVDRSAYRQIWEKHGWRPPGCQTGKFPRRLLGFIDWGESAPSTATIQVGPSETNGSIQPIDADSGWAVHCHDHLETRKREGDNWHYLSNPCSIDLEFAGQTVTLQMGFQCPNRKAIWQWVQMERLWTGPIAQAWQIGGTIYAGAQDRPLTTQQAGEALADPCGEEQMIMVKLFVVLYKNGTADCHAHFINGELYGRGGLVEGKPLIQLHSHQGIQRPGRPVGQWRLTTERLAPFGGNDPAAFSEDSEMTHWIPFAQTQHTMGRASPEAPFRYYEGSDRGFPPGFARTARFGLSLGSAGLPSRYLASPEQYLLAGDIGGVPLEMPAKPNELPDRFKPVEAFSRAARAVHLRNEMKCGFSTGGVFRYLDNFPDGRWEFSNDGNEAASFFRGAYLLSDAPLYDLATRNADFTADINCDHARFVVHYHGVDATPAIYSLIYMRFGGLVQAYLESGDPYYLETAEAAANRWISLHRQHWPRRNMGRDAEPVEGILLLHDYTGQDYYFDAARRIALDVVASLDQDGMWRSGAGAGPFWGANALVGSPWNGAHLAAGLAEFMARCPDSDPAWPVLKEGARRYLRKWIDLVAEMNHHHRTGVGYAWRRHFSMSLRLGEPQLQQDLLYLFEIATKLYQEQGEAFFKNGHHCAGYIDAPWYFLTQIRKSDPSFSGIQ